MELIRWRCWQVNTLSLSFKNTRNQKHLFEHPESSVNLRDPNIMTRFTNLITRPRKVWREKSRIRKLSRAVSMALLTRIFASQKIAKNPKRRSRHEKCSNLLWRSWMQNATENTMRANSEETISCHQKSPLCRNPTAQKYQLTTCFLSLEKRQNNSQHRSNRS